MEDGKDAPDDHDLEPALNDDGGRGLADHEMAQDAKARGAQLAHLFYQHPDNAVALPPPQSRPAVVRSRRAQAQKGHPWTERTYARA